MGTEGLVGPPDPPSRDESAFKIHPKCVFDPEVVATQLRLGFVASACSDGMGRVTAVYLHLRRGTVKIDLLTKPARTTDAK